MPIRDAIVPLVGALTWVAAVGMRLRSVDERLWIARDDAVITLSHARNAADFGSIGISPGDRVEGFSSPLHFAFAYLIELVADPGYRSMSIIILVIMSALTGAFAASSLHGAARNAGLAPLQQAAVAVALTALAAGFVAASWTSVGWIGSGMENPVVICAGLAVAAISASAISPRRRQLLLVVALALFMISRVELAAFSAPLVVAAAWMHSTTVPHERRMRYLVETVAAALLVVAVVHLARRWYFGDWLPNTAVVQGRATGFTQMLVIALVALIPLAALAVSFIAANPTIVKKRMIGDVRIVGALLIVGLVLMSASGRTGGSLTDLGSLQPLPPLLLLIAVLLAAQRSLTSSPWVLNHVFAGLCVVPLGQFIAMGPARLESFRVAVIAVPFLAVWATALTVHVVGLLKSPEPLSPESWPARVQRVNPQVFAIVIVLAMVAGIAVSAAGDGSRRLNWEIGSAPILVDAVDDVRNVHFPGGLALMANPDLGKVSYAKNSIITDLAMLGDPLLTKLAETRPDLVTTFLHFVARPDVLEAHGVWACTYAAWLSSPVFADSYTFSDDEWDDGRTETEDCGFGGLWVIWVRADADAEYELTRSLLAATDPVPVVQAALDQCANSNEGVLGCQGLRRSLQRASQALRESGTYDAAVDVMRASPSAAFDLPMLRRGRGWADDASAAFISLMDG